MSRRVSEAIRPEFNAKGEPAAFWYRDVCYRVRILATWRLRDRWWMANAPVTASTTTS